MKLYSKIISRILSFSFKIHLSICVLNFFYSDFFNDKYFFSTYYNLKIKLKLRVNNLHSNFN